MMKWQFCASVVFCTSMEILQFSFVTLDIHSIKSLCKFIVCFTCKKGRKKKQACVIISVHDPNQTIQPVWSQLVHVCLDGCDLTGRSQRYQVLLKVKFLQVCSVNTRLFIFSSCNVRACRMHSTLCGVVHLLTDLYGK